MEAEGDAGPKKKLILSASASNRRGFKRQREMITVFLKLLRERPEAADGWTFVLAGEAGPGTPIWTA